MAVTSNNDNWRSKIVIKQFLRFVAIGVFNTGVDFSILNLLMALLKKYTGWYYTVFKTISFSVAATFSYFLNKNWAFEDKSKGNQGRKFSQFFIVSLAGAIINVGTASLVVAFIPHLIPQANDLLLKFVSEKALGTTWGNIGALCGTGVGLIWNFLGYKLIVFKK